MATFFESLHDGGGLNPFAALDIGIAPTPGEPSRTSPGILPRFPGDKSVDVPVEVVAESLAGLSKTIEDLQERFENEAEAVEDASSAFQDRHLEALRKLRVSFDAERGKADPRDLIVFVFNVLDVMGGTNSSRERSDFLENIFTNPQDARKSLLRTGAPLSGLFRKDKLFTSINDSVLTPWDVLHAFFRVVANRIRDELGAKPTAASRKPVKNPYAAEGVKSPVAKKKKLADEWKANPDAMRLFGGPLGIDRVLGLDPKLKGRQEGLSWIPKMNAILLSSLKTNSESATESTLADVVCHSGAMVSRAVEALIPHEKGVDGATIRRAFRASFQGGSGRLTLRNLRSRLDPAFMKALRTGKLRAYLKRTLVQDTPRARLNTIFKDERAAAEALGADVLSFVLESVEGRGSALESLYIGANGGSGEESSVPGPRASRFPQDDPDTQERIDFARIILFVSQYGVVFYFLVLVFRALYKEPDLSEEDTEADRAFADLTRDALAAAGGYAEEAVEAGATVLSTFANTTRQLTADFVLRAGHAETIVAENLAIAGEAVGRLAHLPRMPDLPPAITSPAQEAAFRVAELAASSEGVYAYFIGSIWTLLERIAQTFDTLRGVAGFMASAGSLTMSTAQITGRAIAYIKSFVPPTIFYASSALLYFVVTKYTGFVGRSVGFARELETYFKDIVDNAVYFSAQLGREDHHPIVRTLGRVFAYPFALGAGVALGVIMSPLSVLSLPIAAGRRWSSHGIFILATAGPLAWGLASAEMHLPAAMMSALAWLSLEMGAKFAALTTEAQKRTDALVISARSARRDELEDLLRANIDAGRLEMTGIVRAARDIPPNASALLMFIGADNVFQSFLQGSPSTAFARIANGVAGALTESGNVPSVASVGSITNFATTAALDITDPDGPVFSPEPSAPPETPPDSPRADTRVNHLGQFGPLVTTAVEGHASISASARGATPSIYPDLTEVEQILEESSMPQRRSGRLRKRRGGRDQ